MYPCATRMRAGDRDPGIAVAARPDREREPPAGAQHSPRLGERCRRMRHQHVAPAAQDAVDRIVGELDPLGVQHPVLDVRQAELGAPSAGNLDHRRAEVARDQATALAKYSCDRESDIALTGRELEHRVAALRRKRADEPFGHGRGDLLPFLPHPLPAHCHRSPVLEPDAGAARPGPWHDRRRPATCSRPDGTAVLGRRSSTSRRSPSSRGQPVL